VILFVDFMPLIDLPNQCSVETDRNVITFYTKDFGYVLSPLFSSVIKYSLCLNIIHGACVNVSKIPLGKGRVKMGATYKCNSTTILRVSLLTIEFDRSVVTRFELSAVNILI
jgi:hypothetical protein